jgi:hypothetical protein
VLAGAGGRWLAAGTLLVDGRWIGERLSQIPALRLNAREICGQSLLALALLTPHSQESQNPWLSQPACFLLQLVCRPRTRLASRASAGRQNRPGPVCSRRPSQSVNIKARNRPHVPSHQITIHFNSAFSTLLLLLLYSSLPSCPPGGPRHAYSSSPSNGCTSYAVSCTKYPCALSTHASLPPHRYHY